MSDSKPSQQAMEAAREWLEASDRGQNSKARAYESDVYSLVALLDRFAAQAKLEEHDLTCPLTYRTKSCGVGWSCEYRKKLERLAKGGEGDDGLST